MYLNIRRSAILTGHQASVFALGASRRRGTILSGAGDGWLVEWDLANPETGRLLARVDRQVFSLVLVPGTSMLVAGNMDGGVHWVDLDDPSRSRDIAHHRKGAFALLPVGGYLLSGGGDGRLTRWSAEERCAIETLQLCYGSIRAIDYSPVRAEIAVGAGDGNIYLLDAESLDLRHVITGAHKNTVFSLRYAPEGHYLLSGGRDAFLRAWDADNTWQQIMEQPAHWFTVNDIVFHPAKPHFATASRDKTVKIWDAKTFRLLKVLDSIRSKGHINSVNCLFWDPGTGLLVSGSDDRSLILWEYEV
jgi:WD40 repeat protein